MRLFLEAPIEYSSEHGGYYYTDDNFQFPGLWVSEEEIVSLVVSRRLAAALPDREPEKKIRLFSCDKISGDIDLDLLRLEEKVSLKNVRYYPGRARGIFRRAAGPGAASGSWPSPMPRATPRQTTQTDGPPGDAGLAARTVDPLHLLVYMGNWHLIAWCHERRARARFPAVADAGGRGARRRDRRTPSARKRSRRRSRSATAYSSTARPPGSSCASPPPAPATVRDQVWFPGQVSESQADGGLVLKFPVADFREVVRDILPFRRRGRGAGTGRTAAADRSDHRQNGGDLPEKIIAPLSADRGNSWPGASGANRP